MKENTNKYNYINENRKDYSVVKNTARVAIYDDLKSPPRVINVNPDITNSFIESLSSCIYDESQKKGGKIPYTVIREITENFIHADFSEIVVSILDNGNTIRFTDQGPGFSNIENAKLPGFTSATEGMKQYIRGVGSGLPTVKDYIDYSDGVLKIENNIDSGSVVTVSLVENLNNSIAFSMKDKEISNDLYNKKMQKLSPSLNEREQKILKLIMQEGPLGVTQINKFLNLPISSIHKILINLEEAGLITRVSNSKRILSDLGFSVCKLL